VLFVLSSTGNRLMAAGQATAAETMIDLAGARNAIRGYDNYKPLSPESALAADPDVIVFPDHAVAALGGRDEIRKLPQLAVTRAAERRAAASLCERRRCSFASVRSLVVPLSARAGRHEPTAHDVTDGQDDVARSEARRSEPQPEPCCGEAATLLHPPDLLLSFRGQAIGARTEGGQSSGAKAAKAQRECLTP
jgi:hypothetical protein